MRIYTKAGDLAFRVFTFPDGQPHFILETYERDFTSVTIELALRTPSDLFLLLLVSSVLRNSGYTTINVDIRYLLGARMDRAIDSLQPFTLEVVARVINSCGFSEVGILDVHSDVATRLIRNSVNVIPIEAAKQAILSSGANVFVCPDKGASYRTQRIWVSTKYSTRIIYCEKTRDPNTGALSGFKVNDYNPAEDGYVALITDDICDGGGTFVGLAKELRKAGAKKVYLYVTHGIFSKGLPLEEIDHVYTTDSYTKPVNEWAAAGRGQDVSTAVTIIPISMKELA